MSSFNLVDEPWIGCSRPDGSVVDVSIRTALFEAPRLKEISDPSPLVCAATYRLLLAVLHAVFGPSSFERWRQIWDAGVWESAPLDRYLTQWRPSFDLFDETRPFYQTAGLEFEYAGPAAKLAPECASPGNNVTLFDHGAGPSCVGFTPGAAARQLIAFQSFTVGGLVSLRRTEDPKTHKSAEAGLLTKSAVAVCRGASLFETLMLNLVRYDPANELPFKPLGDDLPAWERMSPTEACARLPAGYLDLLTWQSRRVRLRPQEGPDGEVRVHDVVIMKGYQLAPGFEVRRHEQMVAYTLNPNARTGQQPWTPLGFQPGRALWRDSSALVQTVTERMAAPAVVEHARSLLDRGALDMDPIPVDLFGMSTDRANIRLWRHERVPLGRQVLTNVGTRGQLDGALQLAEAVGNALRTATKRMAELAVSPTDDGRSADRSRVTALSKSISGGAEFWWRLDQPFRDLVRQLESESSADAGTVLPLWLRSLRTAAHAALKQSTRALDHRARYVRAGIEAERMLGIMIARAAREMNVDGESREETRGSAA